MVAASLPLLSQIDLHVIWFSVTSVDLERSIFQYKHLLIERRESLTDENTHCLPTTIYYNGDINGTTLLTASSPVSQ